MSGFAGVVAVVLAQLVAGAAVFTWTTALWSETKRSYFTLNGFTVTLLFAIWGWLAASAGVIAGDQAGLWSARLALVSLVVTAASSVACLARSWTLGRVLGIASTLPALGTLGAMAAAGRQGYALSILQLLAGAAYLGAAYHGLFLGHWYLTDRALTRVPIRRATAFLLGATVVEVVAIVAGGFERTESSEAFNPLLTAGALAPWIALGMAGVTFMISVLIRAALRGERSSAVQSATGFYYLAVVTAITGEIAVRTRFFSS